LLTLFFLPALYAAFFRIVPHEKSTLAADMMNLSALPASSVSHSHVSRPAAVVQR